MEGAFFLPLEKQTYFCYNGINIFLRRNLMLLMLRLLLSGRVESENTIVKLKD